MNRRKIIISLIILETIIILVVTKSIFLNKKQSVISESPLKRSDLVFRPNSVLKYFYELKPETTLSSDSWVPYKASYTINSDTLNERYNYSVKKPAGVFRIITLGDSFTYGLYVDTKNNWTELLEDELNKDNHCTNIKKFEVINLGVPGYDIQYDLHRYELRGAKYHPDLVLWLLNNEDFWQVNELMYPIKDEIHSDLVKSGQYDSLVSKGNLYPEWSLAEQKIVERFGQDMLDKFALEPLSQVKNIQTKILFITFPSTPAKYLQALQDKVRKFKNISISSKLPDISKNDLSYPDGHPNIQGHKEIAKSILAYLKHTNALPPCKR